jgi:molybdopterin/thiamine biosynthesis adenylyltransferase
MNSDQFKYYSRQIKLIGSTGQESLKNSRVLVIGAGGLGCPVLQYLAGMGIGTIGIVDHDTVDTTNLHRQILYSPSDVGESKAESAAKILSLKNPHIKIQFFNEKVKSDTIAQLIEDFEIIVDCTDNFETKFLVHDNCKITKKILVQASIYQYEGNLHVFDFTQEDPAPCLRCLWTKEPLDGVIGTCGEVGVIGATAGVLGSLQAMEVLKIILRKTYLKNGEGLFVDLLTGESEKRRWKKRDECLICNGTHKSESFESYKLKKDNVGDEFIWIDLRTTEEALSLILKHPKVIHMPLSDFNITKLDLKFKYLLVCQKGYKSNQVARALRESGHQNFFSLEEGIQGLFNNLC